MNYRKLLLIGMVFMSFSSLSAEMTAKETLAWINSTLESNPALYGPHPIAKIHYQLSYDEGEIEISDYQDGELKGRYWVKLSIFIQTAEVRSEHRNDIERASIRSNCKCAKYSHKVNDWEVKKEGSPRIGLAHNKTLAKKLFGALKYLQMRISKYGEDPNEDSLPF